MKKTILPQLLIAMVCCVGTATAYNLVGSCLPDCTYANNGEFVRDPRDCRRYYVCLDQIPSIPQNCPEQEAFDPNFAACVPFPDAADTCPPPNPECVPTCKFECPSLDKLASHSNCNRWYECNANGGVDSYMCTTPNQYFDGSECQSDSEACCDPCMAYCTTEGQTVPDPFNCTRYYYCLADNYFPSAADLVPCPNSQFQYYSPLANDCIEDSTCSQLCHCQETMICEEYGYFPKCSDVCSPEYFKCDLLNTGEEAYVDRCDNNKVLDPDLVMCVDRQDCSYPSIP